MLAVWNLWMGTCFDSFLELETTSLMAAISVLVTIEYDSKISIKLPERTIKRETSGIIFCSSAAE